MINVYSLAEKKISAITTEFTNSWSPIFEPSGEYLEFLSNPKNRDYNEVLGVYDLEFANPKATRVFLATLRADTPSPFAPQSDEEGAPKSAPDELTQTPGNEKGTKAKEPKAKEPKTKEKKTEAAPEKADQKAEDKKPFRIDLDGIGNRIVALPMPATNIAELTCGQGLPLLQHGADNRAFRPPGGRGPGTARV